MCNCKLLRACVDTYCWAGVDMQRCATVLRRGRCHLILYGTVHITEGDHNLDYLHILVPIEFMPGQSQTT